MSFQRSRSGCRVDTTTDDAGAERCARRLQSRMSALGRTPKDYYWDDLNGGWSDW